MLHSKNSRHVCSIDRSKLRYSRMGGIGSKRGGGGESEWGYGAMMALAGEWETVAFPNHPSRSLFSSDPERGNQFLKSTGNLRQKPSLPLFLYQLPACRAFLVGILAQQKQSRQRTHFLNKEQWRWFNSHVMGGESNCACPVDVETTNFRTAILFPVLRCGFTSGVTALRFCQASTVSPLGIIHLCLGAIYIYSRLSDCQL